MREVTYVVYKLNTDQRLGHGMRSGLATYSTMLEDGETLLPINVECTGGPGATAVLGLSLTLLSPTADDTGQVVVREHVCCPRSEYRTGRPL